MSWTLGMIISTILILHFPFLSMKPSTICWFVSVFRWINSYAVIYLIGLDSRYHHSWSWVALILLTWSWMTDMTLLLEEFVGGSIHCIIYKHTLARWVNFTPYRASGENKSILRMLNLKLSAIQSKLNALIFWENHFTTKGNFTPLPSYCSPLQSPCYVKRKASITLFEWVIGLEKMHSCIHTCQPHLGPHILSFYHRFIHSQTENVWYQTFSVSWYISNKTFPCVK